MITANITETKARFYELIDKVITADEIVIITKYGKSIARLIKHAEPQSDL